jgi:3'(2'), 5'-bisphosphate nucleotidase
LVASLFEETLPEACLVAEEDSRTLRAADESLQSAVLRFISMARAAEHLELDQLYSWIDRGAAEPGGSFWTLDPIDGTKGFLRGEQYVVALAYLVKGRVVVGALGCPNLNYDLQLDPGGTGCVLIAVRGEGAWVLGPQQGQARRLQVSSVADPSRARLLRSVEAGHTNVDQVDAIAARLGSSQPPIRLDSQAKYALLAGGQAELIFRLLSPQRRDYREMIWDQAAGALLVEEAGGMVSDLQGQVLDFTTGRTLSNNRGVLVSNRLLHSVALEALQSVGASE